MINELVEQIKNSKNKRKVYSNILAAFFTLVMVISLYSHWYSYSVAIKFYLRNSNDISFKVYYMINDGDGFSERNSVQADFKAGKHDVKILLPVKKLSKFRMGFSKNPGAINFSNLRVSGQKIRAIKDYTKFEYRNIDSRDYVDDGSLTIISSQDNPHIVINGKYEVDAGHNIRWFNLLGFTGCFYAILFAFFWLVLREKKKKVTHEKFYGNYR